MTKELKQIKLTIFHNDETKSTITAISLEKWKTLDCAFIH